MNVVVQSSVLLNFLTITLEYILHCCVTDKCFFLIICVTKTVQCL